MRKNIHTYVKQGGVRPAPPAAKSSLMVGFDLFTGKAVPADLKKDKDGGAHPPAAGAPVSAVATTGPARPTSGPPPAPVVAVPVPPSTSSGFAAKANPFAGGDAFDGDDDAGGNPFGASAPPAPPAGRPAAPPAPRGANMVEALFDHEAEEEDELNFSTGDLVEVIDKPDGGWWRGRCHGKEGLFPSNYVKS